MKSFGPPSPHIAGRDYSIAVRGPLLTDAAIDRYVLAGYYGEARRAALIAAKKPRKRKPKFDAKAAVLRLLSL